jgi:PAS domain S-box-containing protein
MPEPIQNRNIVTIVLCFAVLFFGISGISQASTELDAWHTEVGNTRALAENDASRALDSALRLQAQMPADATPADKIRILNLQSRIEIYLEQTEKAEKLERQAMLLAKQNSDLIGQVEANLNIALNPVNEVKIDDQFAPAMQSMELLREMHRPDLLVEAMLRSIEMDRRFGRSVDTLNMSMEAMEIARQSNMPRAMAYASQALAISDDQTGNVQAAIEQYKRMLEHARVVPSKLLEADALAGLGSMETYSGDVAGGKENIRAAIDLYDSVGGALYASDRIAIIANSLLQHGLPAAALPYFNESIRTHERYRDERNLWWVLNARSQALQTLNRFEAAQADAERSYALAKKLGIKSYLSEGAKRLSSVAAARGNYRQAYRYFIASDEARNVAEHERVNKRVLEIAKRYVSENLQLKELNHLNEEQKAELQRRSLQHRWLWTVLGSSLLLLLGTLVFISRQRRYNLHLETANSLLEQSQNKLKATFDAIPDLLFVMGLDGRCYEYHSPRTDLLAAPADVLIGRTVQDILPPATADVCMSALREADETGYSFGKQYELTLPQGRFWFELSIAKKSVGQEREPRFVLLSRDITERKNAEETRERLARAFKLLSEGNKVLIHARNEQELLVKICQLTVETGGYLMAWVGYAEDDASKTVRPVAQSGYEEGYLESINVVWADMGCGQGPTGSSIRTRMTIINQNCLTNPKMLPWREAVIKKGYQSSIALPIVINNHALGALTMYSDAPDAFGKEEVQLLEELVNELAYGIQTLRTRAEQTQLEAREKVRLRIFEGLARGSELPEILNLIVTYIEGECHDSLASIMLLDAEREHLLVAAGSNLPSEYQAIINGIAIGEGVGSCGTAAWRGETVIAEDLRVHPFWAPYKQVTLQAGLQSCWSQPIFDSLDKVIGTFGIYRRTPSTPNEKEIQLVRRASHLAAIAIEHTRSENMLRESEEKYRTLIQKIQTAVVVHNADTTILTFNTVAQQILGLSEEQLLGKTSIDPAWHFFREDRSGAQPDEFPVNKVLASRKAISNYVLGVHRPGLENDVWVLVNANPVFDNEGEIIQVIVTFVDINERKKTEQLLEESRRQLRGLTASREKAREEERRYIAREVHDELGQILTGLKLNVSVLEHKYAANSAPLREHLQETLMLTDRSLEVARNVASALRPAALEMGIVSGLEWLAGRFGSNTNIHCEVHIKDDEVQFEESKAIALFRIVQESLTNISRYAKADKVIISLEKIADDYVLKVRDNGIGFDVGLKKVDSFGLVGIRERALLLGGAVAINSQPGDGTEIVVSFPANSISEEL